MGGGLWVDTDFQVHNQCGGGITWKLHITCPGHDPNVPTGRLKPGQDSGLLTDTQYTLGGQCTVALEYQEEGAPIAPATIGGGATPAARLNSQVTTPQTGLPIGRRVPVFVPPESETVCEIDHRYFNCQRLPDGSFIKGTLAEADKLKDEQRERVRGWPMCKTKPDCGLALDEIEKASKNASAFQANPYLADVIKACGTLRLRYFDACQLADDNAVNDYIRTYNDMLAAKTRAYRYALDRPNSAPSHLSDDRSRKTQAAITKYPILTNDPCWTASHEGGRWAQVDANHRACHRSFCTDASDSPDGKCYHWMD